MKCSACYADNAAWTTVCVMCGQPVVPLEVCALGHLLPPGSRECAVCPSTWPEPAPFSGPALLRGVLVVEKGHLVEPRGGDAVPYLEVRDAEFPITLALTAPDTVERFEGDATGGDVRILMRPEGIQVCRKGGKGGMVYEALDKDDVKIEGVRFRLIRFDVPARLR